MTNARTLWTAAAGFGLAFLATHWLLGERGSHLEGTGGDVRRASPEMNDAADPRTLPALPVERDKAAPTSRDSAPDPRPSGEPPVKVTDTGTGELHAVHGRVTGEGERPLSRASVVISSGDGERRTIRTDGRGRYAAGLESRGPWTLLASEGMSQGPEVQLRFEPGEIAREVDLRVAELLALEVRLVTPEGEPGRPPLSEALGRGVRFLAVATARDPGDRFKGRISGGNNPHGAGAFWGAGQLNRVPVDDASFGFLILDENRLGPEGSGWASLLAGDAVLGKASFGRDDDVVNIVVDPETARDVGATVTCVTVDGRTAEVIEGAELFIADDPFAFRGGAPSDEAGVAIVDWTLPGPRWVVVKAENYATHVRPATIPRGGRLDLGTIELWPPVTIEGRVVDENDGPLVARLRWGRIDGGSGEVRWARQRSAESKIDGTFAIPRLEPGRYLVQVTGLRRVGPARDASIVSAPVSADRTAGLGPPITLRALASVRLELTTGLMDEPWPSATLWNSDGYPVESMVLGRWGPSANLDAVPGTYDLVVKREGKELLRRAVVLEQPLELTLDL